MVQEDRHASWNESALKHKESFEKLYSQRGYRYSWVGNIPSYGDLYVELGYSKRNCEILERAKGKANYILDLGCGVGDLVLSLSELGKFVVGAEMTRANMAEC